MAHRIKTNKTLPAGAFGEVVTGELTPQVQLRFGLGLPPQLGTVTTVGASASGAVNSSTRLLELSTGAATSHKAIFETVQPAAYHPGQGALARFTSVFTTGVTGSNQFIGIGDASDGLFIGYQGATFGILRRVGGSPEIQTLSITTGSDADGGTFTITLGDDGTKVITAGNSETVSEIARTIVETDFTALGWKVLHKDIDKGASPQNSATIYFISINAEAKTGSFTLTDTGSSGVAGTFTQNIVGVAPTDNFTAQSDFNIDILDGNGQISESIDFTKGNVFQIKYQWLGFGAIEFSMEDPASGKYVAFHLIKYANANTSPTIFAPTLPIRLEVENTTNNTDIVLGTSSIGAFSEGTKDTPAVTYHGAENSVSLADGTETPVIAIKNDLILNSTLNRVRLRFNAASVSIRNQTGGQTATVLFRARANVQLTSNHAAAATTTNFVSTDTTKGWNFLFSAARVDVTSNGIDISTLAKAGVLQFATGLGGEGNSLVFDLSDNFKDALLAPGAYFVITAERVSGSGTVDVDVAVNWQDIFA